MDTTLPWATWPSAETSPARSDVEALERRTKTAPKTSMPAVLLQLGRLTSRLLVDSAYAAARPNEFFYQEFAGSWLYTGWHFTQLIERFPGSQFADDAAYELTLVPQGGECEGYLPCRVSSLWIRLEPFLRAHPTSPFADSAVQRTLLAFAEITPGVDLVRGSEMVDVPEIRRLVDALEHVARTLDARLGNRLLVRVGELREQMGDVSAARSVYRGVSDTYQEPISACAAGHVRRLEARLARP